MRVENLNPKAIVFPPTPRQCTHDVRCLAKLVPDFWELANKIGLANALELAKRYISDEVVVEGSFAYASSLCKSFISVSEANLKEAFLCNAQMGIRYGGFATVDFDKATVESYYFDVSRSKATSERIVQRVKRFVEENGLRASPRLFSEWIDVLRVGDFKVYRYSTIEVTYVKISRRNRYVSYATTLRDDVEELAGLISKALSVKKDNAAKLAYLALNGATPE